MKYRTICVDPPWRYDDNLTMDHAIQRGAATNYDVMTVAKIAEIPVGAWAESDAHLYIWTTNAFMVEAHELAKAWGFEQKTILTWCKTQISMGHYYRNSTEHVLFCVRGRLSVQRHDVPTHFVMPRGRHSAKPEGFYDMVETMSPGPYLDVFARRQRLGWETYGLECFTPESLKDSLPTPR